MSRNRREATDTAPSQIQHLRPTHHPTSPGSEFLDGSWGSSAGIKRVYELIDKVAATDANVLIQGESGTGKEVIARAIHNLSRRRDGPLITANVGALPSAPESKGPLTPIFLLRGGNLS